MRFRRRSLAARSGYEIGRVNQVNVLFNHGDSSPDLRRASYSRCIAPQHPVLRSGGHSEMGDGRNGRKDEPRTTVSLFRVRCYGTGTTPQLLVSNRTAPKGHTLKYALINFF